MVADKREKSGNVEKTKMLSATTNFVFSFHFKQQAQVYQGVPFISDYLNDIGSMHKFPNSVDLIIIKQAGEVNQSINELLQQSSN